MRRPNAVVRGSENTIYSIMGSVAFRYAAADTSKVCAESRWTLTQCVHPGSPAAVFKYRERLGSGRTCAIENDRRTKEGVNNNDDDGHVRVLLPRVRSNGFGSRPSGFPSFQYYCRQDDILDAHRMLNTRCGTFPPFEMFRTPRRHDYETSNTAYDEASVSVCDMLVQ